MLLLLYFSSLGYFRLPLLWVIGPIPLIDDAIIVDQCSHHSVRYPFYLLLLPSVDHRSVCRVSPHFSLISSFVLVDLSIVSFPVRAQPRTLHTDYLYLLAMYRSL